MVQPSDYPKQDWGIWTKISAAMWVLLLSGKLLHEGFQACLGFFQLF
jgi:hypothetical protein